MSDTLSPPDKATRLTPREEVVIRTLHACMAEHGYSPTLEELAARMGIPCGRTGAFQHICHLVKKGWVEVIGSKGRRLICLKGIRMVPAFDDTAEAQRLLALLEGAADAAA